MCPGHRVGGGRVYLVDSRRCDEVLGDVRASVLRVEPLVAEVLARDIGEVVFVDRVF